MSALHFWLIQALHGLVYGMLLFLVTSGLTLAFGMMRILNIAHAGFYMLGAYVAYAVGRQAGPWAALLMAPIIVGVIGGLLERTMLRRVAALGHSYELLLTFGIFFMIQEAVLWIWGSYSLRVPAPNVFTGSVALLGGRYPAYRLFILVSACAVCLVMAYVLLRTRVGIVIRSTVSDAPMVSALGIDTSLVRLGVFSAATGLAGFAGAIAGPFLQADPLMGRIMLLDGFIVIVLGGFGSVLGALVASLALGELQSFGVVFAPNAGMVLPFAFMALVLVVRPQGFFGGSSS